MALVTLFRNVRKYYNVTTLTNRMFSICNISGCNYNKLSPFLQPITKVPVSFDSLLWTTKLGNEKPRNTLQNGFKFLNGLFANERFEFVGKTFEHGKNIWIKADFSGLNNTIITYRVDFNLSELTYLIKTIVRSPKKNAAFQNTLISSTEKHAFYAKKIPGEKLTIALKNNGRNHEFFLDFLFFTLPVDLQSLLLVQYGGNWITDSSKIIKEKLTNGSICTKECETLYGMIPTFDIPKPSIFNCTLNSTNEATVNTTLKYVYIGDKTAYDFGTTLGLKYGLTTDLTLNQNELIEYEIRESLCANSNLVKIQIQNIQSSNNTSTNTTYSFNIWKRFNSIWIFVENFKKEAEICTSKNVVHFEGNGFTFLCNNTVIYFSNLYSYSYYAFVKANYVVEGIPQKLNCNIK